MMAPLEVAGKDDADAAALHARARETAGALDDDPAPVAEDMLSGETIAALTSGRPKAGDGFHVLVMDLHREINRLQARSSDDGESRAPRPMGSRTATSRPSTAFMTGCSGRRRSNSIIPASAPCAARRMDALLIQNDIGTTEAHVLVVKVAGLAVTVTYTDVHLPRVAVSCRALCAEAGMSWQDVRARQAGASATPISSMSSAASTPPRTNAALDAFLERLGRAWCS